MQLHLVLKLSLLDAGILILDIIDNVFYEHCELVPLVLIGMLKYWDLLETRCLDLGLTIKG